PPRRTMSDHAPPQPADPHATLAPPDDPALRETLDPRPAAPPERATLAPPPHPAADTARDIPARIGRFEVRSFLGAGSFGTVYRAPAPQLDREVALKVARAAGQSPDQLARFRREARTAAGLRHPHIVPLFEAGEADGQLYLASAYVP